LGQVSALAPDYDKAKVAAARLFKIFDRKSLIDSSSENGLRPVRTISLMSDIFEGPISVSVLFVRYGLQEFSISSYCTRKP